MEPTSLVEAVAALNTMPGLGYYELSMSIIRNGQARWGLWDGAVWHYGATLRQLLDNFMKSRNLGVAGTIASADESLVA